LLLVAGDWLLVAGDWLLVAGSLSSAACLVRIRHWSIRQLVNWSISQLVHWQLVIEVILRRTSSE